MFFSNVSNFKKHSFTHRRRALLVIEDLRRFVFPSASHVQARGDPLEPCASHADVAVLIHVHAWRRRCPSQGHGQDVVAKVHLRAVG